MHARNGPVRTENFDRLMRFLNRDFGWQIFLFPDSTTECQSRCCQPNPGALEVATGIDTKGSLDEILIFWEMVKFFLITHAFSKHGFLGTNFPGDGQISLECTSFPRNVASGGPILLKF